MGIELTEKQKTSLALFIKLMRATNTVSNNVHRHLENNGLTQSQFAVLEALYHLGPLCQGDLGSKILKSNANLTSLVDALEKMNLAVRDRSGEDRRKVIVRLTKQGRTLVEQIFPRHAAVMEQEFSVLNKTEKETLGTLLKKVGLK